MLIILGSLFDIVINKWQITSSPDWQSANFLLIASKQHSHTSIKHPTAKLSADKQEKAGHVLTGFDIH